MRRVYLCDAALPHAAADGGDALVVAAEAQMVQSLLFAFNQKDLILVAAVAAEGENTVALTRRQAESRVEFLAGFELGHGEGVTQQRLHRHQRPPTVGRRRGSYSAASRRVRNLYIPAFRLLHHTRPAHGRRDDLRLRYRARPRRRRTAAAFGAARRGGPARVGWAVAHAAPGAGYALQRSKERRTHRSRHRALFSGAA